MIYVATYDNLINISNNRFFFNLGYNNIFPETIWKKKNTQYIFYAILNGLTKKKSTKKKVYLKGFFIV